jgi:DNA-binding MarR family transcriptional regulator
MLSRTPVIPSLEAVLKSDRVIHEPARLVILAILSAVQEADFSYLMTESGLTQGNLSAHLTKLEDAGYVGVEKSFNGKRPRTTLVLTDAGRKAFTAHAQTLQRFFKLTGVV